MEHCSKSFMITRWLWFIPKITLNNREYLETLFLTNEWNADVSVNIHTFNDKQDDSSSVLKCLCTFVENTHAWLLLRVLEAERAYSFTRLLHQGNQYFHFYKHFPFLVAGESVFHDRSSYLVRSCLSYCISTFRRIT